MTFLVQPLVVIFHAEIRRTVYADISIATAVVREAYDKCLVKIRDAANHVTLRLKMAPIQNVRQ